MDERRENEKKLEKEVGKKWEKEGKGQKMRETIRL